MKNPAALAPLRHPAFRMLWLANLASNIGLFVQNTAAGWLMTSLDPSPMMVSLVQAASMLPVFLLALPAGALADIMDRRLFLIGAQLWMAGTALLLCVLSGFDALGPWGLVALTFALGAGLAMTFPAWAATTPELVPRSDLVSAIALNGIGFNITRAIGPAIGGLTIAWFGMGAAFALNAACLMVMVAALFAWKRAPSSLRMPREHFLSAVRAGTRFVAATPAMHAAIIRAVVFFLFGSAVWGLLPLLVRDTLGLGPQSFGLLLGCMGVGAVGAGFLLPALRGRLDRSGMVLWASLIGALAMAILALLHHWSFAALGMTLYGVSWISAASTLQASAQMAAPAWVRARAIGIYQMCFFGALAAGSALSGWIAGQVGVTWAMALFALGAALGAITVRGWRLEGEAPVPPPSVELARPAPAAAELRELLHEGANRVLEVVRYQVPAADRDAFLAIMAECRLVRLRGGAATWRLYEDIAQPDRWVELWAIESWAEHLREVGRLSDEDRGTLARAAAFHVGEGGPEAVRYVNVPV
ncbi:MFS transporter [Roseococcus sp. SDR]|uniref:MFS transporter n=1 Tax=Roseococcus sp. SDR TaxID=2835532 RepID=UPI001BCC4021|nr:MFS transporter [Roseococcus sp. SDR]MBS7791811.1 MFS transporter [Roseococcus sp. SDR]MBV1847125.1 MFS transporter [Roseococcus sp. SDR]